MSFSEDNCTNRQKPTSIQHSGVLMLRHGLEPAVQLHRVELALKQRAHHHRQPGLVHEALEYGAELHHLAITSLSLRPTIVGAFRATTAVQAATLKSLDYGRQIVLITAFGCFQILFILYGVILLMGVANNA